MVLSSFALVVFITNLMDTDHFINDLQFLNLGDQYEQ